MNKNNKLKFIHDKEPKNKELKSLKEYFIIFTNAQLLDALQNTYYMDKEDNLQN